MTTTNQGAKTVLGTPYYISPEMVSFCHSVPLEVWRKLYTTNYTFMHAFQCEGKPYDDKSDMWALGCILYEMACLQRTFEGSNLPALVNKIMKVIVQSVHVSQVFELPNVHGISLFFQGHFAPIKGDYSQEFKNLIIDLLQREPEYRPSASDIWNNRLPEVCNHTKPDGSHLLRFFWWKSEFFSSCLFIS